jgi:hypothetical protein
MLLALARTQKVDLTKISILALANAVSRASSTRRASSGWSLPPTIS